MRTTLDLADDIYIAIRHIASRESKTAGQLTSQLVRLGLQFQAGRSSETPQAFEFFAG